MLPHSMRWGTVESLRYYNTNVSPKGEHYNITITLMPKWFSHIVLSVFLLPSCSNWHNVAMSSDDVAGKGFLCSAVEALWRKASSGVYAVGFVMFFAIMYLFLRYFLKNAFFCGILASLSKSVAVGDRFRREQCSSSNHLRLFFTFKMVAVGDRNQQGRVPRHQLLAPYGDIAQDEKYQ